MDEWMVQTGVAMVPTGWVNVPQDQNSPAYLETYVGALPPESFIPQIPTPPIITETATVGGQTITYTEASQPWGVSNQGTITNSENIIFGQSATTSDGYQSYGATVFDSDGNYVGSMGWSFDGNNQTFAVTPADGLGLICNVPNGANLAPGADIVGVAQSQAWCSEL